MECMGGLVRAGVDTVDGFVRTGGGLFGCAGDLEPICESESVGVCLINIGVRTLLFIVGIIVTIYRAAARLFYCIFPCLRGLEPPPPALAVNPLLAGYSKGRDFQRVAFQINWNANNPLFNTAYLERLRSEHNIDWRHAHNYEQHIREFFILLLNNEAPRGLNANNARRLKQMVLATMNTLDDLRRLDEERFNRLAPVIFNRMGDSLQHCMNNINPAFESIMIDVMANSANGTLAHRVLVALQSYRINCLQVAVHNVLQRIQNVERRDYHMSHEAASVTYYLKSLFNQVGLPQPASALDAHYEEMAYQNAEDVVLDEFNRITTPTSVTDLIYNIIGDVQNLAIPTALFTEWVTSSNRVNDSLQIVDPITQTPLIENSQPIAMLDENGYYHKRLIIAFLTEINVLAH